MAKKKTKKDEKQITMFELFDLNGNLSNEKVTEEIVNDEKEKSISLFDFLNNMFNIPNWYKSLNLYERGKYVFIINRYIASQYPYQCSVLSKNNINPGHLCDIWYKQFLSRLKKKPSFFYYKTSNKQNVITDTYTPSKEAILMFKQDNEIDNKIYMEIEKRYKEKLYTELKVIDDILNNKQKGYNT